MEVRGQLCPWGRRPWYALNRKWMGPRSGPDVSDKKKILPLPEMEPARSVVSILIQLSWLLILVTNIFIKYPFATTPGPAEQTRFFVFKKLATEHVPGRLLYYLYPPTRLCCPFSAKQVYIKVWVATRTTGSCQMVAATSQKWT
jgi:hypothetical protein